MSFYRLVTVFGVSLAVSTCTQGIGSGIGDENQGSGLCACEDQNRACVEEADGSYTCGDCATGYSEREGECVLNCAGASCGSNELCLLKDDGAVCRETCPNSLIDDGNGHCVECLVADDCDAGFYCSAADPDQPGTCVQDCNPEDPVGCEDPNICTANGRCLVATINGESCGAAYKEGDLVEPMIMLVVDYSGSMDSNNIAPGVTRWEGMVEALADPMDGVVPNNEDDIDFGMLIYSGAFCSNGDPGNTFPVVDTAPGNAQVISDELDLYTSPNGFTPSQRALREAADILLANPSNEPKYIIFATDGEPNTCDNTTNTESEVLSEVQTIYSEGITTFAIGVNLDTDHLKEVAFAGQGLPPDSTEPSRLYVATDPASLSSELNEILSSTLNCEIRLENFDPQAQTFNVYFDGDELDESQWQFGAAPGSIEIIGDTCDEILNATEDLSLGVVAQDCRPPEQ